MPSTSEEKPYVLPMKDGKSEVEVPIIQLKFYNSPVDFWKRRFKDRDFWFKVSSVDMRRRNSEVIGLESFDGHESSNINDHIQDQSPVKIAVLKSGMCVPRVQEQFGHKYDPDEFVLFTTSPVEPESVTFMVDFYTDDTRNGFPVPEHIGFCYILPSNLRGSSGSCTMPITGKKHLPIGQVAVEYLMMKPLFGVDHGNINMSKLWRPDRRGLDVGHRGAGSARRTEKSVSCSPLLLYCHLSSMVS